MSICALMEHSQLSDQICRPQNSPCVMNMIMANTVQCVVQVLTVYVLITQNNAPRVTGNDKVICMY